MKRSKCWFEMVIGVKIAAAGLLLVVAAAAAAPSVPGFFTDNMVLQRDKPVPLWGWAAPGEKVVATFAGQEVAAVADARGRWMLELAPMPASAEARELKVGEAIALKNVVVGDVWICSGQSNMEWTLGKVMNAGDEVKSADYPLIRHVKFGHATQNLPATDIKGDWQVCTPQTAGGFSAVGYFFARKLHQDLGVPVGLIGSNWGGTRIEPWTAPEGFRKIPELKDIADRVDAALPQTETGKIAYGKALADIEQWLPTAKAAVAAGKNPPEMPSLPAAGSGHQDPARIYNSMISPLIPYAIRGAIWYQGESNGGEGVSYFHKKQALIGGWRELWRQGDFAFYFVQLANFGQATDNPEGGDGWSLLREAQTQSLNIPNTGMAVIVDIGQANNIHPANKQDVGLRLALWALANEYGVKDLVFSGPIYKSHRVDGNRIRIDFDHSGGGLMVGKKDGLKPAEKVAGGELKRFAVAGADKQWRWATATIEGNAVVVSSPEVAEPVAVRYAFSHNPDGCNLYNAEGLPASPFRTDNW